jgi:hypothetical protein
MRDEIDKDLDFDMDEFHRKLSKVTKKMSIEKKEKDDMKLEKVFMSEQKTKRDTL